MLVAYVDASGDTGCIHKRGSRMYSLGCVVIRADDWPGAFERAVALRRGIRDTYGVPTRAEIKANYLIRGSHGLRGLQPAERRLIYRAHMDVLAELPAQAFAVATDKTHHHPVADGPPSPCSHPSCCSCFDLAWEALLQRLERTTRDKKEPFMIVHDEGEDDAIRAWARRSRRYLTAGSAFGPGSMGNKAAERMVEDPISRTSHQSYFLQMADLVAYAAFRWENPPGKAIEGSCPQNMWERIGAATLTKVSGLRTRSAPGIVIVGR